MAAAVAGWQHPMSREALVLADVFDLTAASNAKRKPKPYPRPWARKVQKSARPRASQSEIRRALAARGH